MGPGQFWERRQAIQSDSLHVAASPASCEMMCGRLDVGNLPIDWIDPGFHESLVHLRETT